MEKEGLREKPVRLAGKLFLRWGDWHLQMLLGRLITIISNNLVIRVTGLLFFSMMLQSYAGFGHTNA